MDAPVFSHKNGRRARRTVCRAVVVLQDEVQRAQQFSRRLLRVVGGVGHHVELNVRDDLHARSRREGRCRGAEHMMQLAKDEC
jgi:hypothetical protein